MATGHAALNSKSIASPRLIQKRAEMVAWAVLLQDALLPLVNVYSFLNFERVHTSMLCIITSSCVIIRAPSGLALSGSFC